MTLAVVWLKRDLRLSDHQALLEAVASGLPVLLLYCFEPMLLAYPHYSARHWRFVRESLQDIQQRLLAWQQGQTGIPMVDACMRSLQHTDYLNFRMRAMLVSFLCHHLEVDWRHGVQHLARLFLDFEPGIHFAQHSNASRYYRYQYH